MGSPLFHTEHTHAHGGRVLVDEFGGFDHHTAHPGVHQTVLGFVGVPPPTLGEVVNNGATDHPASILAIARALAFFVPL